ncbi:MAG: hypothetical protein F4X57_00055 [Chloroflexi bacterium]|nr:hypothetical protein [Chloroflexota bacterium]
MTTQLQEKQPVQIVFKKSTRPRRTLPLPVDRSAETLAAALFDLPESHTWVFMKGKSFRD